MISNRFFISYIYKVFYYKFKVQLKLEQLQQHNIKNLSSMVELTFSSVMKIISLLVSSIWHCRVV